MTQLMTESRLAAPDLAYTAVIDAHRDLTDVQSAELNARLVLILANHIGSEEVLAAAIALARTSM